MVYGFLLCMCFDIVLNNLFGLVWIIKEIKMISDGQLWCLLVYVLDICDVIGCVLDVLCEKIYNQIFNVGSIFDNYCVKEIVEIVVEIFIGCLFSFGINDVDNCSYCVLFDKISI